MKHRSRLCHFVIDVGNLDEGLRFWGAALRATEEPVNEGSEHVYRRLTLPDYNMRVLLHLTADKSRVHLDIEAADVEVERLERLGGTRATNQTERGYNFWVMLNPWGNYFCLLQPTFPRLLHGSFP